MTRLHTCVTVVQLQWSHIPLASRLRRQTGEVQSISFAANKQNESAAVLA
jgi:hypothetical protein